MPHSPTTPERSLRRRRAVAIFSVCLVILLLGGLTWALYRQLMRVSDTPADFKSFIDSFGITGWLVALGIQMLQVLVALIPGEPVEIGMGCAFGAVNGTLLCLTGVAIASTVVFLLTKRFGIRLAELFFPREKIDSLRFINSEKKLDLTVFILFFIPGTPKDLLTYFVGLTRMRLSRFLIISLIARLPSVISSVIGGNLISNRQYAAAVVVFAVTGAVSLLGMVVYDMILKHKQLSDVPKTSRRLMTLFLKICALPHGSGNTAALAAWCLRFAARHGLTATQDAAGNVYIEKPATAGYETQPPVILQGHLDMVCEKEAGRRMDFRRQPIRPVFEKDILTADGTTLGADDGIGMAMILALLEDKQLAHPALQAVFTVDEETGMEGAMALDVSLLHGRRLLNLDSEEEGILIVGCSGGLRADCRLPVVRQSVAGQTVTVTLTGLAGGHSGMDIDKGHANANVLLIHVLDTLTAAVPLSLTALDGGTVDNAIAVSATATVVVPADATDPLLSQIAALQEKLQSEWSVTDPQLTLTATIGETGTFDAVPLTPVLPWLLALPNGVQQMSPVFPGKPETSLNMGVLSFPADHICASFSLRSFRDKALAGLAVQLRKMTADAGGTCETYNGYPGWEYRKKAPFHEQAVRVFGQEYGHAPQTDAIHAGLECGIFCSKVPDMECISIGPDITGAHTTAEAVSIASVDRTYRYIRALLQDKA